MLSSLTSTERTPFFGLARRLEQHVLNPHDMKFNSTRSHFTFLLFVGLGSGSFACGASARTSTSALDLSGGWASDCMLQQGSTPVFAKLVFNNTARTWALDYAFFADESCS